MRASQYLMWGQWPEQWAFINMSAKTSKSSESLQSVVFPADKLISGVSSLTITIYWLFLPRPAVFPKGELSPVKHTLFLQHSTFSWLPLRGGGLEDLCPQLLPRKSFHWHLLQLGIGGNWGGHWDLSVYIFSMYLEKQHLILVLMHRLNDTTGEVLKISWFSQRQWFLEIQRRVLIQDKVWSPVSQSHLKVPVLQMGE